MELSLFLQEGTTKSINLIVDFIGLSSGNREILFHWFGDLWNAAYQKSLDGCVWRAKDRTSFFWLKLKLIVFNIITNFGLYGTHWS